MRERLKILAEEASEDRLKESMRDWRNATGCREDEWPDDWELEFWHAGYKHGAFALIEVLESVQRQAREAAWDEGARAGYRMHEDRPADVLRHNPYRREEKDDA